jgi:hypothetical protein
MTLAYATFAFVSIIAHYDKGKGLSLARIMEINKREYRALIMKNFSQIDPRFCVEMRELVLYDDRTKRYFLRKNLNRDTLDFYLESAEGYR